MRQMDMGPNEVEMAGRGLNPFNGSMRRRLEIDPAGPHQFFVVSRVRDVVVEIERAIEVV